MHEALAVAERVGFPVLVRPSYVLGGRAMRIVYDRGELVEAMQELDGFGSLGREGGLSAERPVLIDRFLEDAAEVDVDAIRDATGEVLIGGVMEHVEEAGVHSGDSACAIPPPTILPWVVEVIEAYTKAIADALDVRGLINVQYAVRQNQVYVLEANPRASRTVPFVAKATGVPLAKVAARVMLGATLAELRDEGLLRPPVDRRPRGGEGGGAAVQPLPRGRHRPRPGDALDRRGHGHRRAASGWPSPRPRRRPAPRCPPTARCSCRSPTATSRPGIVVARRFKELGLAIVATSGTAELPRTVRRGGRRRRGQAVGPHRHVGRRPDRVGQDQLRREHAAGAAGPRSDGSHIRMAANVHKVSCVTTVEAALAAAHGMAERAASPRRVAVAAGVARRRDGPAARTRRTRRPHAPRSVRSTLPNPVMTASGTAGHGAELAASVDLGGARAPW